MSFYDLPKVRIPKQQVANPGMTKQTAERLFAEKCALKKQLRKQLAKCEKDLTKYYLTMTKK